MVTQYFMLTLTAFVYKNFTLLVHMRKYLSQLKIFISVENFYLS